MAAVPVSYSCWIANAVTFIVSRWIATIFAASAASISSRGFTLLMISSARAELVLVQPPLLGVLVPVVATA